ncbi:AN1-type zinc finger protein 4 [Halocaridina rubra]|uniref:AN1-type zinc finger protein 4 n=1 Tax=Halocaridina rubra TaxID=373956 RepID=A0AAN8WW25_HALRR
MPGDYNGQRGGGRRSRQSSRDAAPGAPASSKDEAEEEEENSDPTSELSGMSPIPDLYSPRETVVLDSSYPEGGPDSPDEDEDEDDALEVVVETLLGDTFRVRVSQWDTVAGLKSLLSRTQGIPMNHQHLLLGQTELVDDTCLIEQGVVDGSTLRLVLAMKGGPVNARRLPNQQDLLLRELSDIMDNKEDVWEGNGGRTVTLLVLRDGDNVNVYRVVENQDGSFSPLNESFNSVASNEQLERDTLQAAEEGTKTRARMKDLQARMDAIKIKKKARMERARLGSSQRPVSRGSKGGQDRVDDHLSSRDEISESKEKLDHPSSRSSSSSHRSTTSAKRMSLLPQRIGRNSRPTTQERFEMRRSSLTKSTILKGLPLANPPVPVDFSRRKPLENIHPRTDRQRLSAVEEELRKSRNNYQPADAFNQNFRSFESYRKSLVRHGMVADSDSRRNSDDDDFRQAWPRRESSVPLYMPPVGSIPRRRYEGERLNRSHNTDLLRISRVHSVNRPKTSPEVLEHRPNTSGGHSTISDRIRLRDPDERLREMINILGNASRGNSRQSNRSSGTPPDTAGALSLSNSLSGSNMLARFKTNGVSVAASTIKGHGAAPPSPGNGALVTSGSREQRDKLREIMKNQTPSSSRRTTPESLKQQGRRPGSGRLRTSPTHLPPVTPRRKSRRKPRCEQCSKRLNLVNTYDCRCGRIFCTQHRYPETHECTFDYKSEGRKLIEMANPLIASHRLPKI